MKAFHEIRHYPTDIKVWHHSFDNIGILAHWHDEIEIIYIRKGSALMTISEINVHAEEGDFILCDKDEVHLCTNHAPDTTMEFLIFESSILNNNYKGLYSGNHLIDSYEAKTTGITEKWNRLTELCDRELNANNVYHKEIITSEIRGFFYQLARILHSPSSEETTPNKSIYRLREFMEILSYMGEHFREHLTLSDIAKKYGFSESHFSRTFKKQTGLGFSKYLNYIRITNAAEMISAGDTRMVDVSLSCGFDSVRNFNRVFLDIMGCTPSQYAKSQDNSQLLFTYYSDPGGLATNANYNSTIA